MTTGVRQQAPRAPHAPPPPVFATRGGSTVAAGVPGPVAGVVGGRATVAAWRAPTVAVRAPAGGALAGGGEPAVGAPSGSEQVRMIVRNLYNVNR